ncbi:hypothetical protein [Stenotrophomonas rhizophila]|uniref:hypothetical protein n=1 Tax=Stenotrophomonas rhizophila TaxID=216778 RepID=UPI0028B1DCB8|nr:hypothetical protein [Stenotrophomonas rhizophila]
MSDPVGPEVPLRTLDLVFDWKLPWLGSLIMTVCTIGVFFFNTGHQNLGEGAVSGLSSFPLLLLSLIFLSLATAISLFSLLFNHKLDRRTRAKKWFLPTFRLCGEYAVALVAVGVVTFKPILESAGGIVASVQIVVPGVFLVFALWLSRMIVKLHEPWRSNAGWGSVLLTGGALVLLVVVITFSSLLTLPFALDGLVQGYVALLASGGFAINEGIFCWALWQASVAFLLWLSQYIWDVCH